MSRSREGTVQSLREFPSAKSSPAYWRGLLVIGIGGLGSTAAHQRAELRLALLSKATVVVDTLEGVKEEAGDLIQAERAGAFQRDQTARAVFSSC